MSDLPTYVVVCLHEACPQESAQYLADRLTQEAGVTVRQEPMRPDGLVLHVSAEPQALFQLAESVGVRKPDQDGVMRKFEVLFMNGHKKRVELYASMVSMFPPTGAVGPLTLAEVQRCVVHAIESVHFEPDRRNLPGLPHAKVMKGSPVLSALRENGLADSFPLHDDEQLDKVTARWANKALSPPLEDIRNYFGENVALYAAFSSFYTAFLIPIAAVGCLQWILDRFFGVDFLLSNVFFAALNLVAVTIFLEMWKRKQNELSYKWGTSGKLRHKPPRPEFRGQMGRNKITGKEEMQYPASKTMKRFLFVSCPVTLGCLLAAFVSMLASFEADRLVVQLLLDPETGGFYGGYLGMLITYLPSAIYSVLVLVANRQYLWLAHHLTEWENHRTQEQFESFVVAKLVLFEFVNTFLALFYIAFYLGDVFMLRQQMFMMLIVLATVNQLQVTLLPVVLRIPTTKKVLNKVHKKLRKDKEPLKEVCQHSNVDKVCQMNAQDDNIVMCNFNLARDPYESTYDDFLELWLQFGHVFLFSSVYPLAAAFALISNMIELRVDGHKLCKLSRKPTPRAMRDIGAWYGAFAATSVVSVMTNCALMSSDADLKAARSDGWTDLQWTMLFVALEHVFLLIRFAVDKLIPDVPRSVKDAMDRDEFLLLTKKKQ